ncbi:hypothetical protein L1787_04130 [Acuticoccus sp. M5D2P5]|uniref:hypothetical protein n=1 Tax=Acuticoccus kalidii TaxID=2910977 RepID=UPI001F469AAD|nr:hypothetical protein [Acuticoccus kalidii]MCF3932604.1 hypothetical protein [Acuticoccus kalidii]
MQIVILGYHRSGTSAATQHLAHCGLFVGHDLLGSKSSNPRGHFEDRVFMNIHERILRENGERWLAAEPIVPVITPAVHNHVVAAVAERDAAHAVWGFKDPRACLFVDLWRTVLSRPRFLICLRHYSACIDSMVRRALESVRTSERHNAHIHMRLAADEERIARSWMSHMLPLLRLVRSNPDAVHIVDMSSLDPETSIGGALAERFGAPLADRPVAETFEPDLFSSRLDREIRLTAETRRTADRIWQRLLAARHSLAVGPGLAGAS